MVSAPNDAVANFTHDPADQVLLRVWYSDASRHREEAAKIARNGLDPIHRIPWLTRYGVVRGLAAGDDGALVDSLRGSLLDRSATGDMPPHVPGVVVTANLARTGVGMLEESDDPRLATVGFRIAGGSAFIAWVRSK